MNEKLLKSAERKEQLLLTALTIPALISVTLIIVIPVGWLFSLSFLGKSGDFSLENYQKMIVYKSYFRVFKTTFNVSFLTTIFCILLGYPLAYFLSQVPKKLVGIFYDNCSSAFLDFTPSKNLCLASFAAEKRDDK